jgi:hypothetical protein
MVVGGREARPSAAPIVLVLVVVVVLVLDLELRSALAAGSVTPADQGDLTECRGKSTPGTRKSTNIEDEDEGDDDDEDD